MGAKISWYLLSGRYMSQKGWQKIKIKPYIVSIRINFGSIRAIVATPFGDLKKVFYKTNRHGKYSITVSAVELWNKIWKQLKNMLLSFGTQKKYMLPKPTEIEQIWIIFTPYVFIKNLWQIHLTDEGFPYWGKWSESPLPNNWKLAHSPHQIFIPPPSTKSKFFPY